MQGADSHSNNLVTAAWMKRQHLLAMSSDVLFSLFAMVALLVACAPEAEIGTHHHSQASPSRDAPQAGAERTIARLPRLPVVQQPKLDGDGPRIAKAQPQQQGVISAVLGDVSVLINAVNCKKLLETLVECEDGATIDIMAPGLKGPQSLETAALYLNPLSTLYRGPLDGSYRKDAVSIIVSDIDNDGHEDIAIQSGRKGAYGAYSYDIFLFDPVALEFHFNRPLSELTVGRIGMFVAKDGIITTSSKSGCCEHTTETYSLENAQLRLIDSVTETASVDETQ